jgi:S1-C subfamily serine protease
VARYYVYIRANWPVSAGTRRAFESARDAFADSLPAAQKSLAAQIKNTELDELAERIPADGGAKLLEPPGHNAHAPLPAPRRDNPYLENVDRAVSDPEIRAAIRRVQPACVRLSGASGCCISSKGQILTAAHVAERLGRTLTATFPDGREYKAACTAIDSRLDLALLTVKDASGLPAAPLAPAPPETGTWVCVIGQPGTTTPEGRATGYGAFHVSVGRIRGFKEEDRLGPQMLGGTKHDAWTYWGHSGSPLFNRRGEIVAMHNSWDSTTAMRHAVTYEAIVHFLRRNGVAAPLSNSR